MKLKPSSLPTVFLALLLMLGSSGLFPRVVAPANAGTPYQTVLGGPLPVCTSSSFLPKVNTLINYRTAEIPIGRANHYYVSQGGADTNDGLTMATAWKTLAKVQAFLGTVPSNVEISFRDGDVWREWQYVPYSGLKQGTALATAVTLLHPPMQTIWAGQSVTLRGGASATETATVMSYTPSTGVVLLMNALALDHTSLNGYTVASSVGGAVSTFKFNTLPPAVFNGAILGLVAGAYVDLPGSDGWQFVGNYNAATGVVTMQRLLGYGAYTSLKLAIPTYLHILSGNITLDDYSDGTDGHRAANQKPTLSAFGWQIPQGASYIQPPSGWTLTSSPTQTSGAVYESNAAYGNVLLGVPAACRAVGDVTNPLTLVGSFEDCDAVPGSWWYDLAARKFYLHPSFVYPPPNMNGTRYEFAYRTTVGGVYVEDVDGVRLRNLHIDGYGAGDPNQQAQPGYAVQSLCSGTHAILYDHVDAYYTGRHALGNVQANVGGIATYLGCQTGFLTGDGGNIVTYSGNGGQEHLSVGCSAQSGRLLFGRYSPYGNNSFGGVGSGTFAHTGGGSNYLSLYLDVGATNLSGQAQVASMNGTSGGAFPYTNLAQCNSFVIGQVFSAREPTPFDQAIPNLYADGGVGNGYGSGEAIIGVVHGAAYTTYINCRNTAKLVWAANPLTDLSLDTTDSGGVHINGDYRFDFSGAQGPPAQRSLWQGTSTISPYAQFYHTRFTLSGVPSGTVCNIYRNTSGMDIANTTFMDDIFSVQGGTGAPTKFRIGTGNLTGQLSNNVYSDTTTYTGSLGYSSDPYAVETSALPQGATQPGSILLSAHEQPVMGYQLQYDFNGQPRSSSTPAIGPYEASVPFHP